MLRQAFTDRLNQAMKAREMRTVSTIRLILAGLKDRDIAARGRANAEGLSDAEIRRMLQAMTKQRRQSIALFEQGKRNDLAQRESEEIAVIESFLPHQLDQADIEAAVIAVIRDIGAVGMKDMGRVMGALRERHESVIDFARAGAIAKRLLS
ncbi:MAG: GatB/YqeY domain-containing protein [Alphaproteobacteria bacterium]|nr:GatB/YqeY domain-containing protein [Alphaproteobacteria bacterium]